MRAAFYKGTRPGASGVYNRLVRAWERGPYSHCELVFSDGISASSSFLDGGVRFKLISFDPANWDIFEMPVHLEMAARKWFTDHEGEAYDLMGNVHLVIGFVPSCLRKRFCSAAMADALGLPDPWRFGPNALACILPAFSLAIAGTDVECLP